MRIGVCVPVAQAAAVKAAGWDYVEESVQGLLHAHDQTEAEWKGAGLVADAVLKVPAANMLVPASLKVTGPEADLGKLTAYITTVMSRAKRCGLETLVFGSGGARMVPEGFPRDEAYRQIVAFLKAAAPIAAAHGVTLVVEHLNRTECNILNGVRECADIVRRTDHPSVKLLFDTYHHWMDGLDDGELRDSASLIRHVHLADKEGRVAPGLSGKNDYRALFSILRRAGYDGRISVEAPPFDVVKDGARVAAYVRDAWANA